ncbi:hypothetical protein [Snodgrassella alvi]|uniref:hypothetical protein n=1 Tax=Snodgrassella alvi TaxID=1196083 RepID=UPI0015D527CE|nr:hypothetical protein [Snodgrassella alvi]
MYFAEQITMFVPVAESVVPILFASLKNERTDWQIVNAFLGLIIAALLALNCVHLDT